MFLGSLQLLDLDKKWFYLSYSSKRWVELTVLTQWSPNIPVHGANASRRIEVIWVMEGRDREQSSHGGVWLHQTDVTKGWKCLFGCSASGTAGEIWSVLSSKETNSGDLLKHGAHVSRSHWE